MINIKKSFGIMEIKNYLLNKDLQFFYPEGLINFSLINKIKKIDLLVVKANKLTIMDIYRVVKELEKTSLKPVLFFPKKI